MASTFKSQLSTTLAVMKLSFGKKKEENTKEYLVITLFTIVDPSSEPFVDFPRTADHHKYMMMAETKRI